MEQLRSLQGPPTDEEVLQELHERLPMLRGMLSDANAETGRAQIQQVIESDQLRLREWLREIVGVDLDPEAGLPQAKIDAHREVDENELGTFPVGLPEARSLAWLNASNTDRERAGA